MNAKLEKMRPPSLEEYLQISNAAVHDVINAFFLHPYGFHGDSGIQHYLYHRLITNAGIHAIWPPHEEGVGKAYLLLMSECYSTLTYQNTGEKATHGRFDMAFIDPATLPKRFDIYPEKEPKAMVAFEVGKNKSVEKMGQFDAPIFKQNPATGDAAKIIRDVLAGHLNAGYVLEFYDGKVKNQESTARKIASQLKSYLDNNSDNRIYVALVLYSPVAKPTVWLYPKEWEEEMSLPYKKLLIVPKISVSEKGGEENKKEGSENRILFPEFCKRCSAGGAALQDEIRKNFKSRCNNLPYGGKSMTVNFNGRLLRIGNSYYEHGECIAHMSSQFFKNLQKELPKLRDDSNKYIGIPKEIDEQFIAAIVNAIKSTINYRE